MHTPLEFLKADFYLQTILGFIIIVQPSLINAAWILLPFGIWQVISAIVLLVFHQNKIRPYYFTAVLIWMCLASCLSYFNIDAQNILTSFAYAIPPILAIFYYLLTAIDYRKAQNTTSSAE